MSQNNKSIFKYSALLAIIGFASFSTFAKEVVYYEPHTGYTERFDSANVPGKFKSKTPHTVIRAGNITWVVTYQDVIDGTGFGFDDAAEGAGRRAVVDAVVNYVNNVLNTTPGTPPMIEVHWDTSTNLPASSTLASMGTFFFIGPNGFENGFAFDHITTGVDPLGGNVDITGQVNFGRIWNSGPGASVAGEFDLATVILHEITHGLGFSSTSTSTGDSSISVSNPGVFTVLNDGMALGTPAGTDLFTAGGTFAGTTANLISDNVFFTGVMTTMANGGTEAQLHAPGTFSDGSSLSHLDPLFLATEVMVPAISSGVDKRAYGVIDIGVLQDIGYSSAAAAGMVPVELINFEVE